MRTTLVVLSSLITIIAVVPYLIDVARGKDKPRIASWIVWAVLAGIGAAASFASHQIPAGVLTLVTALGAAAVAVLGFQKGNRKFEQLDIACLAAAAVGLFLLLILKSPTAAVIIVIGTDLVGSIPTIIHCWQHPEEETWITYALYMLGEVITLSIADFSVFTAFAYPVFYLIEDGALAAFILISPHRKTASVPTNAEPAIASAATNSQPTPPPPPPPALAPPPAPAGLKASSPTQVATLRWDAVPSVTSYNIFRNGALFASSNVAMFVDTLARDGSYKYFVTSVGPTSESPPSNGVTVQVDLTPPTISYKLSEQANEAGWHKNPVTISFSASDANAGVASCSPPITLSTDGAGQSAIGSAMNFAGASASVTATVSIDQTPPTLGVPSWSADPTAQGTVATLSIPVVDHVSGVAKGEYIGDPDPGLGEGTPMEYINGNLSIAVNTSLPPGAYTIKVRAMDCAGNWSALQPATLTITQPIQTTEPIVPPLPRVGSQRSAGV